VSDLSLVALGGGHGLSATLKAALQLTQDVTAIVTTADDGGSSGKLRQRMDYGAPGDLRRCLLALAPNPDPFAAALGFRFTGGELAGHAVGNMLIVALAEQVGDMEEAVAILAEKMNCTGRVIPATTDPVKLFADTSEGLLGSQADITRAGRVDKVWLEPSDARSPLSAVAAVANADQLILGPGSFYSSVVAATLPPMIHEALRKSNAQVTLVANLVPGPEEVAGESIAEHLAELERYGIHVGAVIVDAERGGIPLGELTCRVLDVPVRAGNKRIHDPQALAAAFRQLF
jgi:uncharacterized cofD-like protein